jgi:hypothetical protein
MNSAIAFWAPICGGALACGIALTLYSGRRQDLGRVLWSAPSPPYRWLALVWIPVALLDAFGPRSRWPQHPKLHLGALFVFAFLGLFYGFNPAVFSVHENGVATGLLCLPWASITGWSWGPKNPWDKEAQVETISLDLEGCSQVRYLCLRTSSPARFLYAIGGDPIKTGVAYDPDLVRLLERYAPGRAGSTAA